MYLLLLYIISVRGLGMPLANVSTSRRVLDAQRLDTRTTHALGNISNFRISRAKARRACHYNKRVSWQQCVSKLNNGRTLKYTWDMVRRIRGKYKANTVSHLKSNNNDITDVNEICNTLVEQFAFNSPFDNYSHRFNLYRLTVERKKERF